MHKRGKAIKTKSQKVYMPNSYFWRNYGVKPGRAELFVPLFLIGLS